MTLKEFSVQELKEKYAHHFNSGNLWIDEFDQLLGKDCDGNEFYVGGLWTLERVTETLKYLESHSSDIEVW